MLRLRTLWLTSLISLLIAGTALAQRRGDTLVGVNGGATLSDLFGGSVNTNSRWGGTAGVFAAFRTTRNTVVHLEANWVQKGGAGVRLDYIEIPLLVGGVAPAYSGDVRFRFYTGIDLSFKVGCTSERNFADCNQVNTPEWSWPFGLQIGRWTPSGAFFGVDVRYSFGLSDAFDTSRAYNRTWFFKAFLGKAVR